MISEQDINKIIQQVLSEMTTDSSAQNIEEKVQSAVSNTVIEDGMIDDIAEIDIKKQLLVEKPADREGYMAMKEKTPARIGIGRAGARYLTQTALRFRADHAAAQDSVFSYVSEDFLKDMGLFSVQSKSVDKDEYITRPDLGRKISDEGIQTIKEKCVKKPQVQIIVADGLSSAAVEANIKDVLPAILEGLKAYGIQAGTPFFVKLGRVATMDVASEVLEADVTCMLIGERPGLVTAESMSAYIAYKATVDMPEAKRTVISNIHSGGTIPVEAGAHIAELIKTILEKKASGVDLKL